MTHIVAPPYESFSAGVWSAANSLLARGYGKPAVKEEIEAIDLPPVVIQIQAPKDTPTNDCGRAQD